MGVTYKDSGVDIERGENLVASIRRKVRSTYGTRVVEGVGGFSSLYDFDGSFMLAAGADGVGTKVLLAQKLNVHDTVGIDLVAMSINDIICTGARPLFFMDYIATGKIEQSVGEQLIDGMVKGCKLSECALIGGESAEMPGLYGAGEYDLAGFAVGEVKSDKLLGGDLVHANAALLGLRSTGFHSNGYSLIRNLLREGEKELSLKLLTPTKIYWPEVKVLLEENVISGLAHITGGGLLNIPRMNPSLDYHLENIPTGRELPLEVETIMSRSGLSLRELCRTFNMGIGMVVATDNPQEAIELLGRDNIVHLGGTVEGEGRVWVNGEAIN